MHGSRPTSEERWAVADHNAELLSMSVTERDPANGIPGTTGAADPTRSIGLGNATSAPPPILTRHHIRSEDHTCQGVQARCPTTARIGRANSTNKVTRPYRGDIQKSRSVPNGNFLASRIAGTAGALFSTGSAVASHELFSVASSLPDRPDIADDASPRAQISTVASLSSSIPGWEPKRQEIRTKRMRDIWDRLVSISRRQIEERALDSGPAEADRSTASDNVNETALPDKNFRLEKRSIQEVNIVRMLNEEWLVKSVPNDYQTLFT
jgi:hypothetical protein